MTDLYQLRAKGEYAHFSGAGTIYSKRVFKSKEAAIAYIPEFEKKVTRKSDGIESFGDLKYVDSIIVIQLELEE